MFRPITHKRKDLMDYKLGYLSVDIIRSEKQTLLSKTVSYEEWIMSKEVYIRVYFFKSNGGLFVYYLSNIV